MNDRETFKDAIETAIEAARKTGHRYFILFPSIANAGFREEDVHLLVPLLHQDAICPDEREDIAFTVFPNGVIRWGEHKTAK